MKSSLPTNISAAFGLLLEEIENEVELANEAGAQAFKNGLYDQVELAKQQAVRLTEYRSKVVALRQEWRTLSQGLASKKSERTPKSKDKKDQRRVTSRLPKGVRTPSEAFRIPILEALTELGGSGRIKNVLERVEAKVKDQLNEADYQQLSSNKSLRWYNSAQWERQSMVDEGLLKSDSGYGVWEISEIGRRYLASHKR